MTITHVVMFGFSADAKPDEIHDVRPVVVMYLY